MTNEGRPRAPSAALDRPRRVDDELVAPACKLRWGGGAIGDTAATAVFCANSSLS